MGKKTLYELLNVSAYAAAAELEQAYQREMESLQTQRLHLKLDEVELQRKLVEMAFKTLRDDKARAAYDAQLSQESALALVPLAASAGEASRRLTAASLEADAAALLAQAALLKGRVVTARAGAASPGFAAEAAQGMVKTSGFLFRVLGGLVVVAVVLGSISMCAGISRRQAEIEQKKAQEKAAIQEYFNQYGVRAANMAELSQLETERRAAERERREQERLRLEKEREERRFTEEAQRLGAQVSENLRRDAERAERAAREDDDRLRREEERKRQLQYQQEEQERRRLQAERRKLGLH